MAKLNEICYEAVIEQVRKGRVERGFEDVRCSKVGLGRSWRVYVDPHRHPNR